MPRPPFPKAAPLFFRCPLSEAIKDAINAAMGDSESVQAGEYRIITYKAVTTVRIDTAALKKAVPDLAAQFTKTTADQSKAQRAITTNRHREPGAVIIPASRRESQPARQRRALAMIRKQQPRRSCIFQGFPRLDKAAQPAIMSIEKALRQAVSPGKVNVSQQSYVNRHLAEWRFSLFTLMVITNPKICKVKVIGTSLTPFRGMWPTACRSCSAIDRITCKPAKSNADFDPIFDPLQLL